MEKLNNIFKADIHYKEYSLSYNKIDGLLSILFFFFVMIVYYTMGRLYLTKQLYLGIPFSLMLACICIILVFIRKQKLSSVGITFYRIKNAIIFGGTLGIFLIFFNNILPGLSSGAQWNKLSIILYNIFYYFIIIGFVEELIFRGYIQTRLYGLVNNEIITTIISAIMFSLMHIPFQMAYAGVGCLAFIQSNFLWLLILVMWHFVFTFLYKKYNSIFTGTIFHGFMDLGNYLFM